VLARLETLDDVSQARVDFTGDLLKLSMRGGHALEPAIGLLNELGYSAEIVSDIDAEAVGVWYDTTSVGDLSRVEAGVIARSHHPVLRQDSKTLAGCGSARPNRRRRCTARLLHQQRARERTEPWGVSAVVRARGRRCHSTDRRSRSGP
jgi:hypothetical protein